MTTPDGQGDMNSLVKALEEIKRLDETDTKVDIINISMSGEKARGLSEIINSLVDRKIIISVAGIV